MTHKELSPPEEVYDTIGDEYYELPDKPMSFGDSMAMQHGIDTSQQDDNSATQRVINTAQNATAVSPVVQTKIIFNLSPLCILILCVEAALI